MGERVDRDVAHSRSDLELTVGRPRLTILGGRVLLSSVFLLLLGLTYQRQGLTFLGLLASLVVVIAYAVCRPSSPLTAPQDGPVPEYVVQVGSATALTLPLRADSVRSNAHLVIRSRGVERRLAVPAPPDDRVVVEHIAVQRGIELVEIDTVRTDPFHLVRRTAVTPAHVAVAAYPVPVAIDVAALRRALELRLGDEQLVGVRRWRPGDRPAAVSWRSMARTGDLVVREMAGIDHATRVILAGSQAPSDSVVGAALSTIEHLMRWGIKVDLDLAALGDAQVRITPRQWAAAVGPSDVLPVSTIDGPVRPDDPILVVIPVDGDAALACGAAEEAGRCVMVRPQSGRSGTGLS